MVTVWTRDRWSPNWIFDIDLKKLIYKDKYNIVTKKAHQLQIKNEALVHRYVKLCKKYFLTHGIVNWLVTLRKKMFPQNIMITMEELNKIDNLQTQLVLQAEKKCRKIKTGEVPYSPEDEQHYDREICLWLMVISKKSGKGVSTRLLARRVQDVGIHDYMRHSITAIKILR